MSTINDLRRVADEMEKWAIAPSLDTLQGWLTTIREFTATPRCPRCGTNVMPTKRFQYETAQYWAECRACTHHGSYADNEQDALAAFYGEGA